jgi:hypothetical protein
MLGELALWPHLGRQLGNHNLHRHLVLYLSLDYLSLEPGTSRFKVRGDYVQWIQARPLLHAEINGLGRRSCSWQGQPSVLAVYVQALNAQPFLQAYVDKS